MRNKITFEKYKMKSPVSVVFTVAAFLKHWAGLYDKEDREAICAGADQLLLKTKVLVEEAARERPASTSSSRFLMITGG